MNRVILILILFCISQVSHACTWWSEPYYIADPYLFEMQDSANQMLSEQNYKNRSEYLNRKYGINNWVIKESNFKLTAPNIVEHIKAVPLSIDFNSETKTDSVVSIIIEMSGNNRFAYEELAKLKINHSINNYSSRFNIPGNISFFVVQTVRLNKVVVSGRKHVKNTACGYIKVRTQYEANRLNKVICDKAKIKKNERACLELEEYVLKN